MANKFTQRWVIQNKNYHKHVLHYLLTIIIFPFHLFPKHCSSFRSNQTMIMCTAQEMRQHILLNMYVTWVPFPGIQSRYHVVYISCVMYICYHIITLWCLASWASYQIRKIARGACAGNVGNVFRATDFKGKLVILACITTRTSRSCRDACWVR